MTSQLYLFDEAADRNGQAINAWYEFVLGYPTKLVHGLLDEVSASPEDVVFDPFCGTGTTLVAAKRRGIPSVGTDCSPMAVFASRVKTTWNLNPKKLAEHAQRVVTWARKTASIFAGGSSQGSVRLGQLLRGYEFFETFGLVERGWIAPAQLVRVLAMKSHIAGIRELRIREALLLLLTTVLVKDVSNMSFGPEAYVGRDRSEADAFAAFLARCEEAAAELKYVRQSGVIRTPAYVLEADARHFRGLKLPLKPNFIITSPPYPTEKDYTRNTRLELVLHGFVRSKKELQRVKKRMVRSHSKGIYKTDSDSDIVTKFDSVMRIVRELEEKAASKTYGFAKLYPRVISEYFGGMYLHFRNLRRFLATGAAGFYVVGTQRTYLQTYTPTAEILGEFLEDLGYEVEGITVWKERVGTTGSRKRIDEEILRFTWAGARKRRRTGGSRRKGTAEISG